MEHLGFETKKDCATRNTAKQGENKKEHRG
jgi:hypothetical protein